MGKGGGMVTVSPAAPDPQGEESRAFQQSPRQLEAMRTLQGAGGAKFFAVDGVTYPAQALQPAAARGSLRNPLDSPPPDHMPTEAVQKALQGGTLSNVRTLLHRRGITPVYVRAVGETAARAYWPTADVQAYLAARPTIGTPPAGWWSTETVLRCSCLNRRVLQRLAEAGRLPTRKIITTVGGKRRARMYYNAAAIRKAEARWRAYRQRLADAAKLKP